MVINLTSLKDKYVTLNEVPQLIVVANTVFIIQFYKRGSGEILKGLYSYKPSL